MRLSIFEDSATSNFFPLVYTRPVYELRCGISSLSEKITRLARAKNIAYHLRPYLANIVQEHSTGTSINTFADDNTLFVNGRILADEIFTEEVCKNLAGNTVFMNDDTVIAAYVTTTELRALQNKVKDGLFDQSFFTSLPHKQVKVRSVRYPWELVHQNAEEIERDYRLLTRKALKNKHSGTVYAGVFLLNKKKILIGKGSVIKPGSVLDAEHGPIIIDRNVTVMPNAFIEGPAYIGPNSVIKVGAKIYHGTSLGPHSKVGGEVEASIVQGYSNKQHDGFLGHSYLGSWINLGADTNTSDLKNTYGNVHVIVNGTLQDTGSQFVGLIMGDHSKSGINVMFDTGTVVGFSSNIYGAGLPPKFIPSFAWGSSSALTVYDLTKSIETAKRMMARRNIMMTAAYESMVRHVFQMTSTERTTIAASYGHH